MQGNNRTVLRGVLFFIILATLPFYAMGIGLWLSAPISGSESLLTQTANATANANGSPTWTPLGLNRTTSPNAFPTFGASPTGLSPLLPTPPQFGGGGLRTPVPTAYVPPVDTPAPSLTPNNDQDRDGIADAQDVCPSLQGPAIFQGCPDTDTDGIPDNRDACVGVGGVEAYNGCPPPTATAVQVVDTDGDGVSDATDQCPSQAGTAANQGCPLPVDTDNDGVLGANDQCPNEAGTAANNGCPVAVDTDGDGIPDSTDACPAEVGIPMLNGCPEDSDNDGFNNNVDQCISDPGPNNGCP